MTFYTLTRAGGPWVYQSLGFTAINGAVLDGSASTPAITSPPDAFWSVAGSAESGITRFAQPGYVPGYSEPADGAGGVWNATTNQLEYTSAALSATYARVSDSRGVALRQPGTLVAAPVKLWGSNITVKAAHAGSFKALFSEWDWAGWIQVQVDRAVSVDANAIRLIGDVAGVNDGTFTQATYNARWVQLAEYCASKGLYLYPCLSGSSQFAGLSLAQIQAVMVSTTHALSAYPNVIGFDIVNEVDNWQSSQGISYATQLSNMATLSAAVRNVTTVPITYSMVIHVEGDWATLAGAAAVDYANSVDFFDAHIYQPSLTPHSPDPFLTAAGAKPLVVGEYGATQADGASVRTIRYDNIRALSERADILGAFSWAINDGSTTPSTQFGMWSDAGAEQTDVTDVFRKGNKSNAGYSLRTARVTVDAPNVAAEPVLVASYDGAESFRIRRRSAGGTIDPVVELSGNNDLYILATSFLHGLLLASPSRLTLADDVNLVVGTGNGSKIGSANTQKLGFWGAAPIAQPTVSGSRASGAAVADLLAKLASAGLIVNSSTAGDVDPYGWGIVLVGDPRIGGGNAVFTGANRGMYARVVSGGSISKVALEVAVSSGNISVAAYQNSGTGRSSVPGTRLATSGAVACPGTGYQEVSLGATITVAAGDWLFLSCDNTTASFNRWSNASGSALNNGMTFRQDSAHPAPSTVGTLAATSYVPILIGVP